MAHMFIVNRAGEVGGVTGLELHGQQHFGALRSVYSCTSPIITILPSGLQSMDHTGIEQSCGYCTRSHIM